MGQHHTGAQRAVGLLLIRLGLVAAATFSAWLIVVAGNETASFPPSPMLAALPFPSHVAPV